MVSILMSNNTVLCSDTLPVKKMETHFLIKWIGKECPNVWLILHTNLFQCAQWAQTVWSSQEILLGVPSLSPTIWSKRFDLFNQLSMTTVYYFRLTSYGKWYMDCTYCIYHFYSLYLLRYSHPIIYMYLYCVFVHLDSDKDTVVYKCCPVYTFKACKTISVINGICILLLRTTEY